MAKPGIRLMCTQADSWWYVTVENQSMDIGKCPRVAWVLDNPDSRTHATPNHINKSISDSVGTSLKENSLLRLSYLHSEVTSVMHPSLRHARLLSDILRRIYLPDVPLCLSRGTTIGCPPGRWRLCLHTYFCNWPNKSQDPSFFDIGQINRHF